LLEKRGLFIKKKYLIDGGEDLLSDSHNFPYVRQIPQIYNMDETGIPLDPRPPNIWTKKVNYRRSGKKEQITVIGCSNAIGQSI